jgi:hypothetical protein
MARIRSIKPEFWVSEQVTACEIPARLTFIGLWTFSDDEGRHPASIQRLRLEVFPGDANISLADVEGWVNQLRTQGLVVQYDGQEHGMLWQITGWHHQRIPKASVSKFPPPTNDSIVPVDCNGKLPPATATAASPEKRQRKYKDPANFELSSIWNAHAELHEGRLNRVDRIGEKRETQMRTRLRNPDFLDAFKRAILNAPVSFDNSDWQVTFDWLIKNDDNVLKLETWARQGGQDSSAGTDTDYVVPDNPFTRALAERLAAKETSNDGE